MGVTSVVYDVLDWTALQRSLLWTRIFRVAATVTDIVISTVTTALYF